MKSLMFLSILVLCSFIGSLGNANEDQCQLANWLDHKSKIDEFNDIIDASLGSSFVRDILKNMDPMNIKDKYIGTFKKNFLGYDYEIKVNLKQVKVKGISGLYVNKLNVTSNTGIQAGAEIRGELHTDVTIDLNVKQLTQTGCKDDEERYLGLCYKKCSLLTHGTYPKRVATNTCAKGFLLWTKGLGCNGFGVSSSGGCAKPYYRMCFTDKLKIINGPCKPKQIQLNARLGLQMPRIIINSDVEVMMCQGELAKNEVACKNLSPNDFFLALIQGKFKNILKRALKRVKNISISSLDLSFENISDANIKISIGKNPFASKMLSFLVNVSKKLLNNNGKIKNFVVSQIEKLGKKLSNDLIQSKLAPSFGSTCYDRR